MVAPSYILKASRHFSQLNKDNKVTNIPPKSASDYKCAVFRPPDEIPRAFYENSGGKEKETLGSNGVMADLNIGLTFSFHCWQSLLMIPNHRRLQASSSS